MFPKSASFLPFLLGIITAMTLGFSSIAGLPSAFAQSTATDGAVRLFLPAVMNGPRATAEQANGQTVAANTPVSGAVFTTVNPDVDGTGRCLNGGPNADAGLVNCNIYEGKQYVWLSGGPAGNQPALADGTYVFAVLVPGGQGGGDAPNDGTPNNLSDLSPTSGTGAGDDWTHRVFSVQGGDITYPAAGYAGGHDFDNAYPQSSHGKIRLMPYDDTTNPGGEYILAVCNLQDATDTANPPVDDMGPGVTPSDCKYDAFKVNNGTPAQDLIVSKTATPSYDLTYAWSIDKSVDKTLVKQIGGNATFNYTVALSHNAGTAGNWKVTGEITVENPNGFDVAGVDVTDAVDNNGVCTVTDGTSLIVPGNGTVVLDYTCTYATAPTPPVGINTATATWFEGAYKHVSGTASFDFTTTTPNAIDECVAVTDSYIGTLGTVVVNLGTVCVGDATTSFTYPRTVPVPQYDCITYDNTATFTTTDSGATGSDSQQVTVCGPAKTGALTIGFWQNKNGQGIILNYSGTSCQALKSWLVGFNPFNEPALTTQMACGTSPALTGKSTTVPSGVVGYVYTVIKAANASGASMNAMLKAQMLATALNVYFSDSTLGGNRIGAPAPIGKVSVDLTQICTDLSCSAFEDSSSVFGGSPKTVAEMLTYAASQANAGGSIWYGNNKSTQELAKDAFDALNNEKVFKG